MCFCCVCRFVERRGDRFANRDSWKLQLAGNQVGSRLACYVSFNYVQLKIFKQNSNKYKVTMTLQRCACTFFLPDNKNWMVCATYAKTQVRVYARRIIVRSYKTLVFTPRVDVLLKFLKRVVVVSIRLQCLGVNKTRD